MDEQQQSSAEESKINLNPLLIVVILIIVAAVGVMLWLGNSKNNTNQAANQVAPTTAPTQAEQPTGTATGSAADNKMTAEQTIAVEGGSFYFKPNVITVKKGQKVKIVFTNAGGMHNFTIDAFNVKSETINNGSTTVEFTPDKTGTFEFYCAVGNHRQMGMTGKLIVQ